MLSNYAENSQADSGPAPEKATQQGEDRSRASESTADTNSPEQIPPIGSKTVLAIIAVSGIYFAQQGSSIAADFNAQSQASWLTASMTILTVVLGPIVAQAADYWGRKWFLVGLSFSGALGGLITARATSMDMAIAGCCLIGTAFGMQPLLHTVVSEVLPRVWRGWAQSIVMLSNALGLFAGLVIGGALTRNGDPNGFRSFFYIGMAFFLSTGLICVFAYRPPPRQLQSLPLREKLSRLDWVSYGLLASGLVLFCLGLSFLNPYTWRDPQVSAPFAIGLALAIILGMYEHRFKKDGVFHHGLFKRDRNFAIALTCVFSEGIGFFAANQYFAYELNVLYTSDNLVVGLNYGIAYLVVIPASLLVGLYCTRTKKLRWITVLAFMIFITFFACMSTTDATTRNEVWGYPVLMGIGLSMTLVTLIAAGQLSVPPDLIAVATGIMISMRSLGGTIGIAISLISSNVASAALGSGLPSSSVEQFVAQTLAHNSTGITTVPGVTEKIIAAGTEAMISTYVQAFRYVWLSAIPFLAVAAVAAMLLIDPSKEITSVIDAPLQYS
ncbi:hypothetical protein N0V82_004802 [Gnomoniopsis sp. IMI 355080]|nr:hypothetical protein N0V82_004802 [Gnomoniopsis sp. IMI 355080]